MPLFRRHPRTTATARGRSLSRFHRFRRARKDPDRVAGGYKAALSNPNTTRKGHKHAKRELRMMGREKDTHVPVMTRIKRAFGVRSTPKKNRKGSINSLRFGGSPRRSHRF